MPRAPRICSRVDFQYTLPKTYSDFVQQLNLACGSGDAEAKLIIERLAPGMAALLKCGVMLASLVLNLTEGVPATDSKKP